MSWRTSSDKSELLDVHDGQLYMQSDGEYSLSELGYEAFDAVYAHSC